MRKAAEHQKSKRPWICLLCLVLTIAILVCVLAVKICVFTRGIDCSKSSKNTLFELMLDNVGSLGDAW